MSSIDGRHVEEAVVEMIAVLAPHLHVDWRQRAGTLEWDSRATAAHVAHDLLAYAGQVAGRAVDGYPPFDVVIAPTAPPRDVLAMVAAGGRLLGNAVASAPPGPVAWHWGMSDAEGFAAMGIAEVLVHTFDITQGLGITWVPPDSLARLVVARLLPQAPAGSAASILLWATGRIDLDGHSRVSDWVWRAARG